MTEEGKKNCKNLSLGLALVSTILIVGMFMYTYYTDNCMLHEFWYPIIYLGIIAVMIGLPLALQKKVVVFINGGLFIAQCALLVVMYMRMTSGVYVLMTKPPNLDEIAKEYPRRVFIFLGDEDKDELSDGGDVDDAYKKGIEEAFETAKKEAKSGKGKNPVTSINVSIVDPVNKKMANFALGKLKAARFSSLFKQGDVSVNSPGLAKYATEKKLAHTKEDFEKKYKTKKGSSTGRPSKV